MAKNKNSKQTRTKTVVSRTTKSRSITVARETDNIYLLKLVLFMILGSQWLRVTKGSVTIPLPIGLFIGLFFARSERFSIDRKIEYAILLISMFVAFWLPIGLEIVL